MILGEELILAPFIVDSARVLQTVLYVQEKTFAVVKMWMVAVVVLTQIPAVGRIVIHMF